MFAPQTLDMSIVIPFLRSQLSSEFLVVRTSAVSCLRQLGQINAARVSQDKLEDQLFVMVRNALERPPTESFLNSWIMKEIES